MSLEWVVTRTCPLAFVDAQVVGVERQVAGQLGHLQIGHRGVQMDRAGDVSMCTSPRISPFCVTLPLISEKVTSFTFPSAGQVALDIVGGKVVLAVGEARLHRAGNLAEVNVAMRR
jgi:hypothetical protein